MLKFICIGSQKAGTTWLYNVLKQHPEVYLPPVKEINYFYEIHVGVNNTLKEKFMGKHWMNWRWRRILRDDLLNYNLADEEKEWYFKYLFANLSLSKNGFQFYKSLFENKEGKISGDITPNYAILPFKMLKTIKQHLPDQKILFILRNPIDRDWSALKMNLGVRKGESLDKISTDRIENYFSKMNPRCMYNKIMNNWGSLYGENLKVLFYDELNSNPQLFFKKVCNFLNVDFVEIEALDKKIFAGIKKEIPEIHLRHLSKMYYTMLVNLKGNKFLEDTKYIQNWIDKCEKFL